MTATTHTCITFACDGCGVSAEHEDSGFIPHFDSRAAAAADGTFDDWDIPVDPDDGPDLCPECVCKRTGHSPDTPLHLDDGRVLHHCRRCGRSIKPEVARKPATESDRTTFGGPSNV